VPIHSDDAEEYTQSLGQILAGSWRQILWADKQGIPKALGLSTRDWVEQHLGGYIRLSIDERREAVAELTEGEGLSNVQAAAVLGVAESTVRADKQSGSQNREDEPFGQIGLEADASQNRESLPHVARATGENEWYTPKEYIDAARSVLGDIDLDPASSDEANVVVQARTYYTIEDNGLAQDWAGRVWMNPPYAADLVGQFATKLVRHFRKGEVTAALVLVNNATETTWFQHMAKRARAVCFPTRRVRFWGPGGVVGAPLQGQAVLYFGDKLAAFEVAYRPFGLVLYAEG